MTKKLKDILEGMENSGSSEQLGVADCLKTIAENGGEQATDKHLLCCAEEMRDAAQSILDEMGKKKPTPNVYIQIEGGVCQAVWSETPVQVTLIDLDNAKCDDEYQRVCAQVRAYITEHSIPEVF